MAKDIKDTGVKKKKGPIRTEAVAPFAIVMALLIVYFTFFFDLHLRKGIEWGMTKVNGAEVSITRLKTSFLKLTFEMRGMGWTNPSRPERNRFEITEIGFGAKWDAILRGKVLVERVGVTGILVDTPRAKPGRVLPPEEAASGRNQMWDLMQKKLEGSALGDVIRILQGFDPKQELAKIKSELKSLAQVNELKTELAQKEKAWKATVASLPGDKDFKELRAKLDSVNLSAKNPAEIQGQIKTLQSVISGTEDKTQAIEKGGKTVTGDIDEFSTGVAKIDNLISEDKKDLEKRLQIPSIDPASLSKEIFGPIVMAKLSKSETLMAMSKKYIPEAKKVSQKLKAKKEEDRPKPPPRGEGKNYEFGRKDSYPKFWVKLVEVSSKADNTEFGGNVEGKITDIVSTPELIGRPTVATFNAEFPKKEIMDVVFRGELDRKDGETTMGFEASVGSYPVLGQALSNGNDLKLAIDRARGALIVKGKLVGDQIGLSLENQFKEATYQMEASSPILRSIMDSALKALTFAWIRAKFEGNLKDPSFSIESNFGQAIGQGLKGHLESKIVEAKAMINERVDGAVGDAKRELNGQFAAKKAEILGPLEEKKKALASIQKEAEKKIAGLKSGASKKAVDSLKKKLKF